MEQEQEKLNLEMADFTEMLKKAYNRGISESDLTLEKLIKELKADLKNMMVD